MNEQLLGFLNSIKKNPSIEEKLKNASDLETLTIIQIAKEAGFDIPLEEMKGQGYWWESLTQ